MHLLCTVYIVIRSLSGSTIRFHIISYRHNFWKKIIKNKMSVFHFVQTFSEIFLILSVDVCRCGVWVCVCVGFVMFGCFGNMFTCTRIYCVLYCLCCVFKLFRLCIFILICFVCTNARTSATG